MVSVPAYAEFQPRELGLGFFFSSLICLGLDLEGLLFLFSFPFPICFYLFIDCVLEKENECTWAVVMAYESTLRDGLYILSAVLEKHFRNIAK